ncbi:acyltransferase [Aeromonas veronii]|uniref:acyltransferase n=1 Tax=Aeromonas veronii TaxID=654 RepID=UPI0012F667F3|nr:acyltransferase [Aeromonas veronii]EKP0314200.1 acyltransferase [Aeromonas veronii]QGW97608.1 acyltransferase [Aeromonas veronii]
MFDRLLFILSCRLSSKNYICLPFLSLFRRKTRVFINGSGNHIISLSKNISHSTFELSGDNITLDIKNGCNINGLTLVIKNEGGKPLRVSIGQNCSFEGGRILIADSAGLRIGDNCIFSWGLNILTSDMHSILDLETSDRINNGKEIVIDDGIWCGINVSIMKGSKIPEGVVIGAGSVIRANDIMCKRSIYSGNPVALIKKNIHWCRERL